MALQAHSMALQATLEAAGVEDSGGWPLPLPEEVVAHTLLPAADESWSQLRLTCKALRLLIDASLEAINLFEPLHEKLGMLQRLPGLREVVIEDATDAGLAAFAALALPYLTQLTRLEVQLAESGRHRSRGTPGIYGGLVLAAHLSCLRGLECFKGPTDEDTNDPWGPSAGAVLSALAQLPALREMAPGWRVCGDAMLRACTELGKGAFRSLEVLDLRQLSAASVEALAQAPLNRLTKLTLSFVDCSRGDALCSTISSAAWAPHLRELTMQLDELIDEPLLADLRLPALTVLKLSSYSAVINLGASLLTGWDLPKLCDLRLSAFFNPDAAAVLAATSLPALTSLSVDAPHPALITLLRHAPWLSQLHSLKLGAEECVDDDGGPEDTDMWRALVKAPLVAMRNLSLMDEYINAGGLAALAGATWIRGLEELRLSYGLSGAAAVAALRSGRGGFAELEAAGRVRVGVEWPHGFE